MDGRQLQPVGASGERRTRNALRPVGVERDPNQVLDDLRRLIAEPTAATAADAVMMAIMTRRWHDRSKVRRKDTWKKLNAEQQHGRHTNQTRPSLLFPSLASVPAKAIRCRGAVARRS